MGKFEIKMLKDDEFQFKLKSGNGEIILTSEVFKTKAECKTGIVAVKKNVINDNRFQRLEAKNGKAYFNLIAENGKIFGTGEMYDNKLSMENGIDSVKKNAPRAKV